MSDFLYLYDPKALGGSYLTTLLFLPFYVLDE